MLTCQNLTISRGYKTIFSNLGFSLFKGSCLNIYGKNGIGKTSLMNYLATLSDIKKDSIFINNIDIYYQLEEYRSISHFIGHKNPINSDSTVLENLKFWGKLYNQPLTIPSALECFGLEKFTDIQAKKLSKGWQRRLALSNLLIKNANIWLLDEPFSNLDNDGIDYLLSLFKIRCEQHGIVIFTSHNPVVSPTICNINLEDFKGKPTA
jgi:heme exporter protein A